MPRTSVLHALAGAGLAAVVAVPISLSAGTVDADASDHAAQQSAAAQRTASAVRSHGERLLTQRVLEVAAAERAAAERAAAERAAAEQAALLAARQAEAERASRARRAADPRNTARALLADRGQADQFSCLDKLWTKESGWKVTADNPTSSAYGIPQALPGRKMASAGADWRTNPATQVRWGIGYIAEVYGSPCAAWRHSQARNWY